MGRRSGERRHRRDAVPGGRMRAPADPGRLYEPRSVSEWEREAAAAARSSLERRGDAGRQDRRDLIVVFLCLLSPAIAPPILSALGLG